MTIRCAVIGKPIEHSLSPNIHQQFAKQCQLSLDYQKLTCDIEAFENHVRCFFQQGGKGLNVTLPFKSQAFHLCDQPTQEARYCESVNTLWTDEAGTLHGDTTDGRGLLADLNKQGIVVSGKRLLILGAGGASRSIIPVLLQQKAEIFVMNRTLSRAEVLVEHFSSIGDIQVWDDSVKQPLDMVINSMSQEGEKWLDKVPSELLINSVAYDMSYGTRAETFLTYCQSLGCSKMLDGWGMLVEQAALSFFQWHQFMPDTQNIEKIS